MQPLNSFAQTETGIERSGLNGKIKHRETGGKLVSAVAAGTVLCVAMVIAALFIKSDAASITRLVRMPETWQAVFITVTSILSSLVLVALIGIPAAFYLSRKTGRLSSLLEMVLTVPMVLPPSITGLALLMTFGRHGLLGGILSQFSVSIPFTMSAVIIVQVFVALPFFVQIMKNAFMSVDRGIEEAAVDCGATQKDLIFRVYLPMNVRPLLSAAIMACLRAAGEFGATIMFAGNLEGKTQTVSTAIYTLSQQNTSMAVSMAALHIVIFLVPLLLIRTRLEKQGKRI